MVLVFDLRRCVFGVCLIGVSVYVVFVLMCVCCVCLLDVSVCVVCLF